MDVAIIKYPAGNVASLTFALERLGVSPVLTDDPQILNSVDKVIFPGQGAAKAAMGALSRNGLDDVITSLEQPFLGICLGLQLMAKHSQEQDTDCLGMYDIDVQKFQAQPNLQVPHMAWNKLSNLKKSPLLEGITEESWFYFVHSYFMPVFGDTLATCQYINNFTAIVSHDNFYAVQFHPEKSSVDGERLLRNFLFGL